MKIRSVFIVLLTCYGFLAMAETGNKRLQKLESALIILGDSLLNGSQLSVRQNASDSILYLLKEQLSEEKSFPYNFDSLKAISILTPKDRSFKIFTWNLLLDDTTYKYVGLIQTKKAELYVLNDVSTAIEEPRDTVLGTGNWYGALYYNIIRRKKGRKKMYFLFGWDGNNAFSTRKLVEVLSFDKKTGPIFGMAVFRSGENEESVNHRLLIEFKKTAGVSLNYDPELNLILYDHLIPMNPLAKGIFSMYVPDGSYCGFEYKKGKWNYVEKVFHQTFDEPPIPAPLKK